MTPILLLTKEDIGTGMMGENFTITTNGTVINFTKEAIQELADDLCELHKDYIKVVSNQDSLLPD